jgi:hypothetical protein
MSYLLVLLSYSPLLLLVFFRTQLLLINVSPPFLSIQFFSSALLLREWDFFPAERMNYSYLFRSTVNVHIFIFLYFPYLHNPYVCIRFPLILSYLLTREHWMIYRGLGFLAVAKFGSTPILSPLIHPMCPVELTDGSGGGGGAEFYENLALYKSFRTLFF